MAQAELYGGALRITLPPSFRDVSAVRQVPDHQEVWADLASPASLVLEIVEQQGGVADGEAARYFWADMLDFNGTAERGWRELPEAAVGALLPAAFRDPRDARCGAALACAGWQGAAPCGASAEPAASSAAQGGASAETAARASAAPSPQEAAVFVCLAVLRLPGVGSEVLVSLNTPLEAPEKAAGGQGPDPADVEGSAISLFTSTVASLLVKDWALFQ